MKLTDKKAAKSHRVLLFGPPKSGKSQLAGELAEKFNLLWVDIENGVDSLLKMPEEWKARVEVISIPDTRVYPMGIQTALKMIKGGPGTICDAHGAWNCMACAKDPLASKVSVHLNELPLDTVVVFDSLTQLTNSAIAHITKNQSDDYKMEYDDWAALGKLMDTFLSQVQQAPFNVVCISHETEVEMEDGKNKLVPTAGTRNFSRNTAKYFDEVFYLEVKNKKHVVGSSTTYSNNILSGSRSGQVLESQDKASLIPVFSGEVVVGNPASINAKGTPAANAVSGLAALRDKMASNKGAK